MVIINWRIIFNEDWTGVIYEEESELGMVGAGGGSLLDARRWQLSEKGLIRVFD